MEKNISRKAESIKRLVQTLPVRRSQATNWLVKIFNIQKTFIGSFRGSLMEVNPMEPASRSAYFLGFYERETTIWTLHFLEKFRPKTIVDIGANFGYFSFLCRSVTKDAEIFAFEPDPFNYDWLKRNVELNSDPKIHLLQKAVGSTPGEIEFMTAADQGTGQNLWSKIKMDGQEVEGAKEIKVECTTLDKFCDEKGLESIDLIKMDIEGAEGYAIEGMEEGLKVGRYKNVLIEFHPYALSGDHAPDKLIQMFKDKGYKVFKFNQTYYQKNVDKVSGTYNLNWDSAIMSELDTASDLSDWEHYLFTAPGEKAPF